MAKIDARLSQLKRVNFREREERHTQFEWLATNLERFDSTFCKRIKALN